MAYVSFLKKKKLVVEIQSLLSDVNRPDEPQSRRRSLYTNRGLSSSICEVMSWPIVLIGEILPMVVVLAGSWSSCSWAKPTERGSARAGQELTLDPELVLPLGNHLSFSSSKVSTSRGITARSLGRPAAFFMAMTSLRLATKK